MRSLVLKYHRAHGRDTLPWRRTRDPYRILVSEVMLQQTQVVRVIPKYRAFVRAFPTARALAEAPLSDVLSAWSGLGYNRRARFLHEAAKEIVRLHRGRVPRSERELRALPGIGEYTACAVLVFAFDAPHVLLETNIRTVILHHFFPGMRLVSDLEVQAVATRLAKGVDPRIWHWALMDYGAHLKSGGVRLNARSRHYVKQSKFKGSLREVRGEALRAVRNVSRTERALLSALARFDPVRVRTALAGLEKDGLIRKEKRAWRVA